MYEKFDPDAIRKLGFYVYALYDPDRPNIPFYVGKGTGNRVFSHAAARYSEIDGEDARSLKAATIDHIHARQQGSNRVLHQIVSYGYLAESTLKGADVAFAIEGALIQMLKPMAADLDEVEATHRAKAPGFLGNAVDGHGSKMIDARDLAMALNATPLPPLDVPCLAFKINDSWERWKSSRRPLADVTRQEYWDAVRGHWPVRGRGHHVILVIGDDVVREVFFVTHWRDSIQRDMNDKGRKLRLREMEGDPNDPRAEPYRARFVGHSVRHLFSNPRTRLLYLPRKQRTDVPSVAAATQALSNPTR